MSEFLRDLPGIGRVLPSVVLGPGIGSVLLSVALICVTWSVAVLNASSGVWLAFFVPMAVMATFFGTRAAWYAGGVHAYRDSADHLRESMATIVETRREI